MASSLQGGPRQEAQGSLGGQRWHPSVGIPVSESLEENASQGPRTPLPAHLHHESVDDVLLGVEPVLHLLLAHDWCEVKLLQVPGEELVYYWNVLFFHWSQSSCLGRLEGRQTGQYQVC